MVRKFIFDENVAPAESWRCRSVGTPQNYNWQMIQMSGGLQIKGGYKLLIEKATNYINQNQLNVNYVNLVIPNEVTTTFISGRTQDTMTTNPFAQASTEFYKCEFINPEHRLGYKRTIDFGVGVN